ncbi:MAG: hypothetical protein EOS07_32870 [Mesorhizobium sp.]|nr:MAG: hypothetical protein EOQ56_34045 [Mesorhizobium sp.]RWO03695.1 MAG: hypothetical protein EOS07_32870 [Mesorhizobium sp.]
MDTSTLTQLSLGTAKEKYQLERHPFGMHHPSLVRAIVSMITAENNDQQPTREANQIAGDLANGQQLTEQKLFGINPDILIPAIISAVGAVIKGQQPNRFDESLRGDAIQIAGDLAKGQQLTEQKLFGINPDILIPAIISAARAVIKGQQPNGFDESLRGDAIQIAGDLAKGQQPFVPEGPRHRVSN